jgi:DNA-binding NarL/FixJ family response regulator
MWSKILVVADQPLMRFGLAHLISQQRDLQVCAEAENVAGALQQIQQHCPHLAIINLPLEKKLHPGLLPQLRDKHPPLKILVGTRTDEPSLACHFIRVGADGCIHWGESVEKVVGAIRAVLNGDVYLSDAASRRLVQAAIDGRSANRNNFESLSDREINIFAMIGQGLTTQQIAHTLDLSPRTVESHRKKIKIKLQLRNASELNHRAFHWWRDNS